MVSLQESPEPHFLQLVKSCYDSGFNHLMGTHSRWGLDNKDNQRQKLQIRVLDHIIELSWFVRDFTGAERVA